jgi:hypothetical protein
VISIKTYFSRGLPFGKSLFLYLKKHKTKSDD